jgi:copper chaperone CopZ
MARTFCYEIGMRIAVLGLVFAALFASGACQRASEPPANDPPAKPAPSATATEVVPAPEPSCGPSCGGTCGGGCEGMADPPQAEPTVPADAVWTEMRVTGMHCGGCARRIRNALAQVDGIYGVHVDVATATVRVATPKDRDGRALAQPRIDALGYHVQ